MPASCNCLRDPHTARTAGFSCSVAACVALVTPSSGTHIQPQTRIQQTTCGCATDREQPTQCGKPIGQGGRQLQVDSRNHHHPLRNRFKHWQCESPGWQGLFVLEASLLSSAVFIDDTCRQSTLWHSCIFPWDCAWECATCNLSLERLSKFASAHSIIAVMRADRSCHRVGKSMFQHCRCYSL